jgi:hypothetical protein
MLWLLLRSTCGAEPISQIGERKYIVVFQGFQWLYSCFKKCFLSANQVLDLLSLVSWDLGLYIYSKPQPHFAHCTIVLTQISQHPNLYLQQSQRFFVCFKRNRFYLPISSFFLFLVMHERTYLASSFPFRSLRPDRRIADLGVVVGESAWQRRQRQGCQSLLMFLNLLDFFFSCQTLSGFSASIKVQLCALLPRIADVLSDSLLNGSIFYSL